MKDVRQIKIFIACPGDIINEQHSIKLVVDEINKTSGEHNNYNLELLNWKTDTYTQIGEDVQEVINKQIEPKYDILVGILWQKVGTPTKRGKSGTIEEITIALTNKEKEQLIYFKIESPLDMNHINLNQLSKINRYKKDLKSKGVLYKEFNSTSHFETLFRIDLTNLIIDNILKPKGSKNIIDENAKPNKYESITKLILEVETKDERVLDIDVFPLVEEVTSYLDFITSSLSSLAEANTYLTTKLRIRTEELNRYKKYNDDRLRLKKIKTTFDLFAKELKKYNIKIQNELPSFSKNFISFGNAYPKVLLAYSSYPSKNNEEVRKPAIKFRDSMKLAMEGCATLLKEMMKLPPINNTFNWAKRETEITLKNLIKVMLDGILLLDEALKN